MNFLFSGTIDWQLMNAGKGNYVFIKDTVPGLVPMILYMVLQPCIYRQHYMDFGS